MVVDGIIRRLQFWRKPKKGNGEAFYASPFPLSQVGENQLANRSDEVVRRTITESAGFRLGCARLNYSIRPGRDDEGPILRIRSQFAGIDVVPIAPWIGIDVRDIRS